MNKCKRIKCSNQRTCCGHVDNTTRPTFRLRETHFRSKDTCTLKVEGWRETFRENENKAGVAVFIADKRDFQTRDVTRDKEGSSDPFWGFIQRNPNHYMGKTDASACSLQRYAQQPRAGSPLSAVTEE